MIKKFTFLIVALSTFSLLVKSQSITMGQDEQPWFKKGWGAGLIFGPNISFTDVKQYSIYPVGKYENERKMAFGVQATNDIKPYLLATGNVIFGGLAGVIRPPKTVSTKPGDMYFTSGITEISFSGRFYPLTFLTDADDFYKPYASLGTGLTIFSSKLTTLDSRKKISNESGVALAIPISIGCDFKITETIFATFDMSLRYTTTDKLDALKSTLRGGNDKYSITSLGIRYMFGGFSKKAETPQVSEQPIQEQPIQEPIVEDVHPIVDSAVLDTTTNANTSVSSLTEGTVTKPDSVTTTANVQQLVEEQNIVKPEDLAAPTKPQEPVADIAPKAVEQVEQVVTQPIAKTVAPMPQSKVQNISSKAVEGLEFRLQIAALRDKAMWRINRIRQKYGIKEVAIEEFVDNWYKYTIGSFKTLDEAQRFKDNLVAKGFSTLFIVAYNNGKRITISEAKTLQK